MPIGLEKIIIRPEQQKLPLDIVHETEGPVFLEIGFGNGEYPVHLAMSRPDITLIGAEVSLTCVMKAARRAKRENLSNIHFMMGDARFLLRECFRDNSLDVVYMNFPCPWPKSRHSKRRVTNPSFADALASVLKKDGYFELLTDEEWYAHEVRDILGAHPSMRLGSYQVNPVREVTTKYERKWLEMGKDIHRVRIVKESGFSIKRVILEGGRDMHLKANIKGLSIEELNGVFDHEGGNGSTHWVFKQSFSGGDRIFLMEVISADEGFEQKFFIRIAESENGTIFKLAETGSPFRTPAVKGALQDLVNRLENKRAR